MKCLKQRKNFHCRFSFVCSYTFFIHTTQSPWPPPPSWIYCKIGEICWLTGSREPRRINIPNFIKIGQSFAEILVFSFLFWANLDHPRKVLGGIHYCAKFGNDRSSSLFSKYESFNIWRKWLENVYLRLQHWGFGAIWPPKWSAVLTQAKKAQPCASPRRLSHQTWNPSTGLTCR